MDNLAPNGSLDTDKLARALLIHRNQTDPLSGLSPAQVIFGRQLRDHLPLQPEKFQPRAEWRMEADQREQAFRKRHLLRHEQISATAKNLKPLTVGDTVAIQDKTDAKKAGKWTKTGIITDSLGFQSYEVKVDGSNTLTTRNRAHLRKIVPFISQQIEDDRRAALQSEPILTRSKSLLQPPQSQEQQPCPLTRPQSPPHNLSLQARPTHRPNQIPTKHQLSQNLLQSHNHQSSQESYHNFPLTVIILNRPNTSQAKSSELCCQSRKNGLSEVIGNLHQNRATPCQLCRPSSSPTQ